MAVPQAPFTLATRDDDEAAYIRFFLARNPSASATDPQIALDAAMVATSNVTLSAAILACYKNTSLEGMDDATTIAEAIASGEAPGTTPLPASASTGYITVTTATTGVTIPDGLVCTINGQKYNVPVGGGSFHKTGDQVQIVATVPGPNGDQLGGATGTWDTPPPGLLPQITVVTNADLVTGLTGGANSETIPELKLRLQYQKGHPAASGNAADYEQRGAKTPAIAIDRVFVYSGINSSGTTGVAFTVRRSSLAISRCPSSIEIAAFAAWVAGPFPSDDGMLACALVSNPITLLIGVTWAGAPGWADANPWPTYASSPTKVTTVTDATHFQLINVATAPAVGTNIAFYDPVYNVFRQKRVLTASFVAGTTYTIVCDTTAGVSDLTYVPAVNQTCGPWSASLNILAQPMATQMLALGPGEQVALWDPTTRQRRDPLPPLAPYTIGNKILRPLDDLAAIQDASLHALIDTTGSTQAIPYTTPVGSPGVSSNLSELAFITVYTEI